MDFKEDIINTVLKNYNGRQVVLWGKYGTTEDIKEKLKENYGIIDACYIDSNSEMVDGNEVFSTDYIMGKSEKCYVVVALAVYESIREKLFKGGYEPNADYYYFSDCIMKCTDEYYEDAHGNRFIGKRDGVKFCFSGWNSIIRIGKGVRYDEGLTLYLHNDNRFEVGDNSDICGCFPLRCCTANKIQIGKNCVLSECELRIEGELFIEDDVIISSRKNCYQMITVDRFANVYIGRGTTIAADCIILCGSFSQIIIGKDCMVSWGVRILSYDMHTIFDVNSGKAINIYDKPLKNSIIIGNHVWIGMRCNILYGTNIGDGSIVGIGSLVKDVYPNNCMIAGSMARIIKRDVAWCREGITPEIEKCGDYVRLTDDVELFIQRKPQ